MQFNSLVFLIFFAIVCLLMELTKHGRFLQMGRERRMRVRHVILLIASYVFYGWWDWRFCGLMLLVTVVAHFCSLYMDTPYRKTLLTVGVVFPLLVLGYFKYCNFFIDSFCALFGITRAGSLRIILPVGISFYTFQSLSYTIDVYRGKLPPERDFVKTALYVAFFPQLVAGPIVKAGEFLPQLYEERNISLEGLQLGAQYFVFGLFKKVVLADNLSVFVDAVHRAPMAYSAPTLLLMSFSYLVQVYCDFSAYSDMAIGCARVLGYDLPRNFNLPFIATNINEFWRRWHISLSTWLREYLYFPLGGSRKGKPRAYLNLFLIMTIGGLWHGANWNMVLWGALQGISMCAHKAFTVCLKKRGIKPTKSVPLIVLFIVLNFVYECLTLIVFRSRDLGTAWQILCAIFTWRRGVTFVSFWAVVSLLLCAAATAFAALRCKKRGLVPEGFYPTVDLTSFGGLLVFFTFIGLTLALSYTGLSPFVYFQF